MKRPDNNMGKTGVRPQKSSQNFAVFKKFSDSLAWDTEVWISDMPDHMIHLNGDRFMRPREKGGYEEKSIT